MAEACGSRNYSQLILQVLTHGRTWKDLASIGTANAAFLPPHLSSGFSHRKNHFHDSTVSLPQCIGHCLCVDVHRCANVRMPQKFLLNFQVHVQCMEQRRVRMPKAVPADPTKSGTDSSGE